MNGRRGARLGPQGFGACFRKRTLLIQHLIHLAPSVAFNNGSGEEEEEDKDDALGSPPSRRGGPKNILLIFSLN